MNTLTKQRGRPKKAQEPLEGIANSLIERMFFIAADDTQMATYYDLLEKPVRGHGLATSYASRIVARKYASLMSMETGLDYGDIVND